MHRRIIVSTLVILLVLSPFLGMQVESAYTPHAIMGYVRDLNGNSIFEATVYVNNTRTNESLNFITDSIGRYSVDIDGYPSGYLSGDQLTVKAVYYHYNSQGTVIINTEPAQQLDLVLSLRIHLIDGYVFKPDGTPANHYSVNVKNFDKNESVYVSSESTGYYRVDISLYPSGFSVNDDITVSVFFMGFNGLNYGVVSANLSDMINITLTDIEPPLMSVREAPLSVNISQDYRINAWVVDNFKIDNAWLCIKGVGDTLFVRYKMEADDGILYDWNGNHWLDPQLFGQTTSLSLPIQTLPGTMYYYIEATDGTFTITLPANNPQTSPLEIQVFDVTPPNLTHTPLTVIESAVPVTLLSKVKDNVMISEINLYYKQSTSSTFSRLEMTYTGNPDEFSATIPSQMYLGMLDYYILCNDTSNNTARLPVIGNYPVIVEDTTAPVITHSAINSVNVGSPINFTCQVFDSWLEDVWINFTDINGTDFIYQMAQSGSIWYYANASGQDAPGVLHYSIWANDSSGNIAHVSKAMAVNDVGTPLITHKPPEHLDYNQTTVISAFIEDDVAISGVNLAYKLSGDSMFTLTGMSSADIVSGKRGNFTAEIPPQTTLWTLEYYINATDGSNNISWPALDPSYSVEILDLEPPSLHNLSFNATGPANVPFYVRANVSDNNAIWSVSLFYLNSAATAWQAIAMVPQGSGVFDVYIPPQKPGIVKLYLEAFDASGNNASLPSASPKINPFTVEFYNTTIPKIFTKTNSSIGVNNSCSVYVIIEDNREDAKVELFYKGTHDFLLMPLFLTVYPNGTFAGTIPAQSQSGTVQYMVRSSLGSITLNQTSLHNISVLNQLPQIQHIGVDSAPVGENVDVVAIVSDDLHVENVTLSWKRDGTNQYAHIPMLQRESGLYSANLSQIDPVVIQYYISASDAEGQSRYPVLLDLEISFLDFEAPVIRHEPLLNLTTDRKPIIIANVTDNLEITGVTILYRNNTSQFYYSVQMDRASGTDNYVALLALQPEGNFTYYIEATDGINTARSPDSGEYSAQVLKARNGSWGGWLLAIVIILLICSLIPIGIYYRRKSIK